MVVEEDGILTTIIIQSLGRVDENRGYDQENKNEFFKAIKLMKQWWEL